MTILRVLSFVLAVILIDLNSFAQPRPVEIHDRIARDGGSGNRIALTLDACSGRFDEDLILFLVRNRIPATLFVTKKWLDHNARRLAIVKAHLDLCDIEDHGETPTPAVVGAGRKVYGIPGDPDMLHLRREVSEGARAIESATGVPPHWYRGATGEYDQEAANEIRRMGYKIAGFTVNADAGATLSRAAVQQRLRHVKGGDVIIAHMNKPASDTAEGISAGLIELLRHGRTFLERKRHPAVALDQRSGHPTDVFRLRVESNCSSARLEVDRFACERI